MLERVKNQIRDRVLGGRDKESVSDLGKRVSRQAKVGRGVIKQAVKELVGEGELQYTYVHGTSFLEPSFDRPVRVSKRIVLKPPDMAYQAEPGDEVIILDGGAAFGNGAHPTTWLALQALDDALGDGLFLQGLGISAGLDVGTGTGVLAIALARLGFQEVLGTDIDPCAIFEARHNVSLNGLSEKVTILDIPVESLVDTYAVILANLACPTLKSISSVLAARLIKNGLLVLSGFKKDVSTALAKAYGEYGLRVLREAAKGEWVCMTLVNNGG